MAIRGCRLKPGKRDWLHGTVGVEVVKGERQEAGTDHSKVAAPLGAPASRYSTASPEGGAAGPQAAGPAEDAFARYQITVAVEMGVTSYYRNKTMHFDADKRVVLKETPPRTHQITYETAEDAAGAEEILTGSPGS